MGLEDSAVEMSGLVTLYQGTYTLAALIIIPIPKG